MAQWLDVLSFVCSTLDIFNISNVMSCTTLLISESTLQCAVCQILLISHDIWHDSWLSHEWVSDWVMSHDRRVHTAVYCSLFSDAVFQSGKWKGCIVIFIAHVLKLDERIKWHNTFDIWHSSCQCVEVIWRNFTPRFLKHLPQVGSAWCADHSVTDRIPADCFFPK